MAKIKIERSYLDHITYGKIFVDDRFITPCFELAYRDNKKGISCIEDGHYIAEHYYSPRHGETLIVHNEDAGVTKFKDPNKRWGILFHVANRTSELAGCIAPVSELTWNGGNASRKAVEKFKKALGSEVVHSLTIVTHNPTLK